MWIQEHCGKCEKENWVYMGRMDDCTAWDREGFICWNCRFKYVFPETYEFCGKEEIEHRIKEDDISYEDGEKCPSNNCPKGCKK